MVGKVLQLLREKYRDQKIVEHGSLYMPGGHKSIMFSALQTGVLAAADQEAEEALRTASEGVADSCSRSVIGWGKAGIQMSQASVAIKQAVQTAMRHSAGLPRDERRGATFQHARHLPLPPEDSQGGKEGRRGAESRRRGAPEESQG